MVIGLIDDDKRRRRKITYKVLDILSRSQRRRGIVGITDVHQGCGTLAWASIPSRSWAKPGVRRTDNDFGAGRTRVVFDGFESGRSLDQLFTTAEKRKSGHPQNLRRSAAQQNLFRRYVVQAGDLLQQPSGLRQRITVRATAGAPYDLLHLWRGTEWILISVQADEAIVLTRRLEYGRSRGSVPLASATRCRRRCHCPANEESLCEK